MLTWLRQTHGGPYSGHLYSADENQVRRLSMSSLIMFTAPGMSHTLLLWQAISASHPCLSVVLLRIAGSFGALTRSSPACD